MKLVKERAYTDESKTTEKSLKPRSNSNTEEVVIDNCRHNSRIEHVYKIIDNNKLKCIYFNARSILNKLDELELYLAEENIDIVGVTETWLHSGIADSEISIRGYNIFRKDRNRTNKKRGGGVAFYIKDCIKVSVIEDIIVESFSEYLLCNIEGNKNKTLIGICYRPPDSSKNNDKGLFELLSKIGNKDCIFLGDFNFSEIKWNNLKLSVVDHPFVKCLQENFLQQLIEEPTRGENFLDLVLANDITLIEDLTVEEYFGTSDHRVIKFNLLGQVRKAEKTDKTFNYFKANYDEIRNFVNNGNYFDSSSNVGSVEELWVDIKSKLLNIRDRFVPLRKEVKSKSKWVTRKVLRCRNAKNKAWKNYIKSNRDVRLYEVYKSKLKESVKANKSAKIEFERKLARNVKTDNKSFYAYVRSKQRNKVSVGPLKDNEGKVVVDDKISADLLNNYFMSVFTLEDLSNLPGSKKIVGEDSLGLRDIAITEEIVFKKLSEINVNKSAGPDNIHPKLLYELRNELVSSLTELFRLSLSSHTVPTDWKEANVVPLFKKGKKDKCENYRPVSLTCILCKIFESILKDNIVEYLDRENLINDSQHGFRKGRSCLTNLLDFFEEITRKIDEGNSVDLVYLDFAKAFDTVPYNRLFVKLESLGITGNILLWIQNWLDNRRQRVVINNNFSEWGKVSSGVPQGSVLGPVLFLIYINDLENNLISKLNKFADDSKLGKTVNSIEDRVVLQRDLDNLYKWSAEWQMQFNIDKCSLIHLGKENPNYDYTLGNKTLKCTTSERDLGVIIDSKLAFEDHCSQVVKQANSTLALIRRTIKYKTVDTVTRLYKALVRPKLEYCVQLWHPYLKKDINCLEQVQHRATKMIKECRKLDYESRLRKCKLISLEDRRTRGDLIEVFKIVKGFDKLEFNRFFEFNTRGRTRGHKYKIVKKRCKTELRRNFFSQRIIDTWNKLPSEVVEADNINTFKNRLDKVWGQVVSKA